MKPTSPNRPRKALSNGLDEICGVDPQPSRQLSQRLKRDVLLRALDRTHVRTMHVELVGESLLGQATLEPETMNVHGKAAEDLVGNGHPSTFPAGQCRVHQSQLAYAIDH